MRVWWRTALGEGDSTLFWYLGSDCYHERCLLWPVEDGPKALLTSVGLYVYADLCGARGGLLKGSETQTVDERFGELRERF